MCGGLMKVDKIILDAMVQGRDVDEAYWKELLLNPNREKLWQDAIDRRCKIDKFCRLAIKFPSVAIGVRKIKSRLKVGKENTDATFSSPGGPLLGRLSGTFLGGGSLTAGGVGLAGGAAIVGGVTALGSLFSTLEAESGNEKENQEGPSSDVEKPLSTNAPVKWGETHIEEFPPGQKLAFNPKNKHSIHYAYGQEEGWISSEDQWEVNLNDGAVVLTFFDQYLGDSLETINLDMALQSDFGSFCLIIMPTEKPNPRNMK